MIPQTDQSDFGGVEDMVERQTQGRAGEETVREEAVPHVPAQPRSDWRQWGAPYRFTPLLQQSGRSPMGEDYSDTSVVLYNDTGGSLYLASQRVDGGEFSSGDGTRGNNLYGVPPLEIGAGGSASVWNVDTGMSGVGGCLTYATPPGESDRYCVDIQWDNWNFQKNHYSIKFFRFATADDQETEYRGCQGNILAAKGTPYRLQVSGVDVDGRRFSTVDDANYDSDTFGKHAHAIVGFAIGYNGGDDSYIEVGEFTPKSDDQRPDYFRSYARQYKITRSELKRMWVDNRAIQPRPGAWLGMVYGLIED
ncbi:hypothetical protein [Allonocardiopsis opalescens]|uniref:hypothetical protein n=1 Tax=Allonocardiopsis opalescens TaxID=1144618 RepID=UPI0011B1DA54|nr:hypothetical protein [Allonocardiopsis opalescens]